MLRLALRVRREQAELVLAELLELAPGGVEEVDVDEQTIEYAVYGSPGELPELPDLQAVAGGALVELTTTEIADDWADRWREFHRPLVLGDRLTVRPPWEPPAGTELDIVIDPGRAFGTGAHATTRLCLELLLQLSPPTGSIDTGGPWVVDLGCGSGVLAIAAAKLGWRRVLALDYDQLAVDATLENAVVNGVVGQIEVQRYDLRDGSRPWRLPGLVLANLLGPLLREWCRQMLAADAGVRRKHPRRIIASGLLVTEADGISEGFAELGYEERHRLTGGEWAALSLEQPERG